MNTKKFYECLKNINVVTLVFSVLLFVLAFIAFTLSSIEINDLFYIEHYESYWDYYYYTYNYSFDTKYFIQYAAMLATIVGIIVSSIKVASYTKYIRSTTPTTQKFKVEEKALLNTKKSVAIVKTVFAVLISPFLITATVFLLFGENSYLDFVASCFLTVMQLILVIFLITRCSMQTAIYVKLTKRYIRRNETSPIAIAEEKLNSAQSMLNQGLITDAEFKQIKSQIIYNLTQGELR